MQGKRLDWAAIVAMGLAVALSLSLLAVATVQAGSSAPVSMDYEESVFGADILTVDIRVDESAWQEMLDNATEEEYIQCDVSIGGTTYYAVGIRPKGNTSLSMVAGTGSSRFSFKIKFDQYVSGQTCNGLDKLVLNNVYSDATYMKEVLSYSLFARMGVPSPLCTYAQITVNGEAWGLYIALEGMEQSFAERNFGLGDGALYKPESGLGEGGRGGPGNGSSSAGADLAYSDGDPDSYSAIFDNAVFSVTKAEKQRMVNALKVLAEGEELESAWDVDEVLRYLAVNTALVNLDHYCGAMLHNYYLYEQDGVVSLLPWDYNLAFGGFQSGSASSAVNFPIDTPVSSVSMEDRPLIDQLLSNEEYLETYHGCLEEIGHYLTDGGFEAEVQGYYDLIAGYVASDPTAFYTLEEFETGVAALKTFGILRGRSILGQLDGTIPSTSGGQSAGASSLIDTGDLNLTDMGTQGGGGFGGDGGMGRGNPPGRGSWDGGQEGQGPEPMEAPGGTAGDAHSGGDSSDTAPAASGEGAGEPAQGDGAGLEDAPREPGGGGTGPAETGGFPGNKEFPEGMEPPEGMPENLEFPGDGSFQPREGFGGPGGAAASTPFWRDETVKAALPMLAACGALLLAGILFARYYRRRRW